jgi:putative ABC transport system permease protein
LTALLAAVGVLLLIACANLANLLLARGAARRAEIALRLSLGASAGRLIRQLITESLALAALGGAAAVAVAFVLHGALVRMLAESDPRFRLSFAMDPLVVAFVVAVTLVAALLFGALPAWQATRIDPGAQLKDQARGTSSSGSMRSGRLLVSLQLALSLPLLVGAGLLARTAWNLQRADVGFTTEHLALLRVDLRQAGDTPRRDALLRQLVAELRRIPGVRAVSYSQLGLFSGGISSSTIQVEGYTPIGDDNRGSGLDRVGPDHFSTLGVPIRAGREIVDEDRDSAPRVCVINEAFAERFFSGRNPIGMRVSTPDGNGGLIPHQVVGVVGNVRSQGLRGPLQSRFYVAAQQRPAQAVSPTFLIRTTTAAATAAVLAAARKTVERVDPALPILFARSLEEQMAPVTAQDRNTAKLAAAFGGVALLLAAIGLYGVLSYGVARRSAEIAIRIAVGAQPSGVISMILRETAALVGVGVLAGGGLAYAASGLVAGRLYGVAPADPLTLAASAALLVSVAFASAYLPARRASRLDPVVGLRQE